MVDFGLGPSITLGPFLYIYIQNNMSKLTDWFDNLEPSIATKILQYGVMPLWFLLIIFPGILYFALPEKHEWLSTLTIVLAVVSAVGFIGKIIYDRVKEAKEMKQWHKDHPAPKK